MITGFKFGKNHRKILIVSAIFLIILVLGVFIRAANLDSLEGQYLLGNDAYLHLRLAEQVAESGDFRQIDCLRTPKGCVSNYFTGVPTLLAGIYPMMKFIEPSITMVEIDILYPLIFFVLILIAFFFLVLRIFGDPRIALLASAFLSLAPTIFLSATVAGYSEKEPLGFFLMFSVFYLYLASFSIKAQKHRLGVMALAGFLTGAQVVVWKGFFVIFSWSLGLTCFS